MYLAELIDQLVSIFKKHGNLPVFVEAEGEFYNLDSGMEIRVIDPAEGNLVSECTSDSYARSFAKANGKVLLITDCTSE